ncbi:hypothetical protein CL634_02240 [bacterium]|nr:hypothetical protein [bacterium]
MKKIRYDYERWLEEIYVILTKTKSKYWLEVFTGEVTNKDKPKSARAKTLNYLSNNINDFDQIVLREAFLNRMHINVWILVNGPTPEEKVNSVLDESVTTLATWRQLKEKVKGDRRHVVSLAGCKPVALEL